jgi:hypothetical protein
MGVLPVALFASGHTFFVQRLAERQGTPAYAVHATFQFSGTPGKRHRLRERALWLAVRLPSRLAAARLPCMLRLPCCSPLYTAPLTLSVQCCPLACRC